MSSFRNQSFDVPQGCDLARIKLAVYDQSPHKKAALLGKGKVDVGDLAVPLTPSPLSICQFLKLYLKLYKGSSIQEPIEVELEQGAGLVFLTFEMNCLKEEVSLP